MKDILQKYSYTRFGVLQCGVVCCGVPQGVIVCLYE